jgi:ribonuclease M5
MKDTVRIPIQEIIVVEGLHDKQVVERVFDTDIWVLGGDRIAHTLIMELQRASRTRGIIVFTDPDGPGERIRRRLADGIPNCKHAFISKHTARSSTGTRVGIEFAVEDAVRASILSARTELSQPSSEGPVFQMEDLRLVGLVGTGAAAARREAVGRVLNIGYANAKSFLRKLNALGISKTEFDEALREVAKKGNHDIGRIETQ